MTTKMVEQGAGGKGGPAPTPQPAPDEEGQLADLPWTPTRTLKSGGALIFVNDGWCKGCGICVEVCPKTILGLDGRDKPVLLDEEHCTGCLRCELLCPDFAMVVVEPPRGGSARPRGARSAAHGNTGPDPKREGRAW